MKRTANESIEAYGTKGMNGKQWRRTFKSIEAMLKWCEKNDATVEGTRTTEVSQ